MRHDRGINYYQELPLGRSRFREAMKTIETRFLYIVAFLAIGYIVGMSFPLVEKRPQSGITIDQALAKNHP